MKIKSNIPKGITELFVFNEKDRFYYNQFGLKRRSMLSFETVYTSPVTHYFFEICNDTTLNIYNIKAEIDSGTIIFDKELLYTLTYNKEYDELLCDYNNLNLQYMIKSLHYNEEIIYQFVQSMYVNSPFVDLFLKKRFLCENRNAINIFYIYYYKANKYFPVLIQNELYDYIGDMFCGKVDSQILRTSITKNIIFIAKNANVNINFAIKLLEKYNFNDLNMLIKLLKYIDCLEQSIFEELCFMDDINFTGFLNYFVKALFVLDTIPVFSNSTSYTNALYVRNFFATYKDYYHLIANEEGADSYPDDLKMAHDAAIERRNYLAKKVSYQEVEDSFVEATEKYSYLACKIEGFDDFEVVVPKCTYDLVEEGKVLHHCVETYINSVSRNYTKICMIRKNNEPYMTIEIRDNCIFQAKKKFNTLPSAEDEKMLKQWCYQKDLTIVNY